MAPPIHGQQSKLWRAVQVALNQRWTVAVSVSLCVILAADSMASGQVAAGRQPSFPESVDADLWAMSSRTAPVVPVASEVAWTSGCTNCEPPVGSSPEELTLRDFPFGPCSSCSGTCIPGQSRCHSCAAKTRVGRFACEIHQALCCPDPCYQPRWRPIADAAFLVPGVRPVTQQRFGWDAGLGMMFPDRAEYFWARADGNSLGPTPPAPLRAVRQLDYHQLNMYMETSSGKFSFFINQAYRSVYPDADWHGAGFAPLDLGTKTLVFDCELLQLAIQFRTYIPIGNTKKGLSNGLTSLEPSLLMGLSLAPDAYVQGQIAQWIPLGGDPDYGGAILHYHLSVNRLLYRFLPDVPLIGTFELNGWSFQDGAYTDPILGQQTASGETYISLGPGLRLFVCDRIDFGVGSAFSITSHHFAEQLIRSEFRFRY